MGINIRGGRYGFADSLSQLKLSFFNGMCLGEIEHVVELAIKKKLLIYEANNKLVPHGISKALQNANKGVPTIGKISAGVCDETWSDGRSCIDSLGELKECLKYLLTLYPEGFNLSTLKTKIISEWGKKLSTTVLREVKLLDLMSMHELSSVACTVRLEGNCGYQVQRVAGVNYDPFPMASQDDFPPGPPGLPRVPVRGRHSSYQSLAARAGAAPRSNCSNSTFGGKKGRGKTFSASNSFRGKTYADSASACGSASGSSSADSGSGTSSSFSNSVRSRCDRSSSFSSSGGHSSSSGGISGNSSAGQDITSHAWHNYFQNLSAHHNATITSTPATTKSIVAYNTTYRAYYDFYMRSMSPTTN